MSASADDYARTASLAVEEAISVYDDIVSDDRPSTLTECAIATTKMRQKRGYKVNDPTQIDIKIYRDYIKKQNDILAAEDNIYEALLAQESDTSNTSKPRTQRKCKALRPYRVDEFGNVKFLVPTETAWYTMYIVNSDLVEQDSKFAKKFRRRFRMPYATFRDFLQSCMQSGYFERWNNKVDATGSPASPLGLLLLGALRYLGRGLTFDDLEEYTAIGEEVHRQFFHQFILYGEEVLYPMFVKTPLSAEEFAMHQHEFSQGGLNGAGFSTDGTNVKRTS